MIALLPALALAAQPGGYFGSTASTSILARVCAASRDNLEVDFCSGYVLATYDTLSRYGVICPGEGVTTEKTMAVVRRFLETHPELWDRSPSWVVEQALREAYPCRKSG